MRMEVSNLKLVYESNPLFCRIELNLAVVKGAVKPSPDATRDKPDLSIPGLMMFWESDTSFRS
jgi:hypothetical protein